MVKAPPPGVQLPTIYRQFGDMQGLLGVVARETLAVHAREQATRALANDPVDELRRGWDLHIAFGLANPDAFALLYSAPSVAAYTSVIHEGVAVLQGLVARIAEAGRLRVDVVHATALIHAAGTGITLTLAATPLEERDLRLSETMREAILAAVTVPASAKAPNRGADATRRLDLRGACRRAAGTADGGTQRPVQFRATAPQRLAQIRLATAASPGAPMQRSRRGTRSTGRSR